LYTISSYNVEVEFLEKFGEFIETLWLESNSGTAVNNPPN